MKNKAVEFFLRRVPVDRTLAAETVLSAAGIIIAVKKIISPD